MQPIITYVKRMRPEMQGLFITSVANNTKKAAIFAVNKEFGAMLAESRNFF